MISRALVRHDPSQLLPDEDFIRVRCAGIHCPLQELRRNDELVKLPAPLARRLSNRLRPGQQCYCSESKREKAKCTSGRFSRRMIGLCMRMCGFPLHNPNEDG